MPLTRSVRAVAVLSAACICAKLAAQAPAAAETRTARAFDETYRKDPREFHVRTADTHSLNHRDCKMMVGTSVEDRFPTTPSPWPWSLPEAQQEGELQRRFHAFPSAF